LWGVLEVTLVPWLWRRFRRRNPKLAAYLEIIVNEIVDGVEKEFPDATSGQKLKYVKQRIGKKDLPEAQTKAMIDLANSLFGN